MASEREGGAERGVNINDTWERMGVEQGLDEWRRRKRTHFGYAFNRVSNDLDMPIYSRNNLADTGIHACLVAQVSDDDATVQEHDG